MSDKRGRSIVHARLRSILMSPTSFTLFRGFNPRKPHTSKPTLPTQIIYDGGIDESNPELLEKVVDVDIVGIPTNPPPNFFDFNDNNISELGCNFGTVLSSFFTQSDPPKAEPNEKNAKLDSNAASAEGLLGQTVTAKAHQGSCDAAVATGTTHLNQEVDDTSGSIMDVGCSHGTTESDTGGTPAAKEIGDSTSSFEFDDVKETELTSWIRTQLFRQTCQMEDVHLAVHDQVSLSDPSTRINHGTTDLMFFPKKNAVVSTQKEFSWKWDGNGKQTPLGLVEFGILPEQYEDEEATVNKVTTRDTADATEMDAKARLEWCFWEKTCQASTYLSLLRKDSKWEWKGPLLLGVFVSTRILDQGCFAVFVCEPKGDSDWRMALMWRSMVYSKKNRSVAIEQLSQAFGAFLKAVDYLAAARDDETPTGKKLVWEYLGPNCTRVEVKRDGSEKPDIYVARSYDIRCRHCPRKLEVYKEWKRLHKFWKNAGLPPMIRYILELDGDESNTLEFGEPYEKPLERKLLDESMLFSKWMNYKGGKVEVILVPYQEGTHVCTSVVQVLSLLLFQQDMHRDGVLHGDVRGFNTVFIKPPNEEYSTFLYRKEANNSPASSHANDEPVAKEQQVTGVMQGTTTPQVADEEQDVVQKQVGDMYQAGADEWQVESESSDDDDEELEASIAQYRRDMQIAKDKRVRIKRDEFKYACFIDFDYGGFKKNRPKYPLHYQPLLKDGDRGGVKGRQYIEDAHDVFATTSILAKHELRDWSRRAVKGLWFDLLHAKDLTKQIKIAKKLLRIFPREAICPNDNYKKHLEWDEDCGETKNYGNKATPDRLNIKPHTAAETKSEEEIPDPC